MESPQTINKSWRVDEIQLELAAIGAHLTAFARQVAHLLDWQGSGIGFPPK